MQQVEYQTFSLTKDEFYYSFQQQTKNEKARVFLESGRGGHYSIAAWQPIATTKSIQGGLQITWQSGEVEVRQGEALEQLEVLIKDYYYAPIPNLPDFQGGAIGFISYDYARTIEVLPALAEDDLQVPDIFFYLFESWAVHNVKTDEVTLMKLKNSSVDLNEWREAWQKQATLGLENRHFNQEAAKDIKQDDNELQVSFQDEDFERAVEKIQQYIGQGDVFQVNLSVRQGKRLQTAPITVFEAVRSFNPSPYMAYIESEDFAVVSGSPELLVKRKGQELSTRPIAGTRPRGDSKEQDEALANELIHHEKERAEHVMLVDLERNDLGRVCEYGTVEVNEFMVIEYYSHVMHIVSNVRGKVATGKTNTDVIRAMFPGGTITGAPKIRTMEIIEELEPVRRGLYTGSIGWIGYTGDLELNIVIRTAYIKDEMAYIQAGAGIVIDSIPANEYIESMNKAKAMWQAKAMAEGVVR
ncbi:MAG: anthranilate synthase component I family protein [Solibacillus sp.]|jgi:para-aminobenzoate synthetase component I|uniref:anthranilate synthase component I family protein n=1 Tax=unclassified Solibacillus TaxID=2637870 RepID=UPI0030FC7CE5